MLKVELLKETIQRMEQERQEREKLEGHVQKNFKKKGLASQRNKGKDEKKTCGLAKWYWLKIKDLSKIRSKQGGMSRNESGMIGKQIAGIRQTIF